MDRLSGRRYKRRVVAFFSTLLQCISFLRRKLFAIGLRKQHRAARPVISIGNVSFGGTGKTPIVIALAKALTARGLKVCILSRGYRRKKSQPTERVNVNGSATQFGDEPLLIARATQVPVVVDAKRARAAAWASAQLQPDVFLLDDGFSHLQLARDLDLVMLAKDDMHLFARRRELRATLREADIVATLESHIDAPPPGLIHIRRALTGPARLAIQGKRVIAMAAIAHPERFSELLRSEGATVVRESFFHDHHPFPEGALDAALARVKQGEADAVVITEKDAVKLATLPERVLVAATEVVLPDALIEQVFRASSVRPI